MTCFFYTENRKTPLMAKNSDYKKNEIITFFPFVVLPLVVFLHPSMN